MTRSDARRGRVKTSPNKLTRSFTGRSRRRFKSAEDRPNGDATVMTTPTPPRKPHPSPWAVGLLFLSGGFTLISIVLFSTVYGLL
jgi:hypothetical protein